MPGKDAVVSKMSCFYGGAAHQILYHNQVRSHGSCAQKVLPPLSTGSAGRLLQATAVRISRLLLCEFGSVFATVRRVHRTDLDMLGIDELFVDRRLLVRPVRPGVLVSNAEPRSDGVVVGATASHAVSSSELFGATSSYCELLQATAAGYGKLLFATVKTIESYS